MTFTVDPDIRRAETLPARVYRDPAIYAQVRERVFARSWQLVADLDQLPTPKRVQPITVLEGCVDEPLVLTRDGEDRLHCLSNVCTHRGNLVACEPGPAAHLRCPYHGRRFALDGTFEHMPEFEATEGFPSERDDLPRVPFETLGKMIFAAVDPSIAFETLFSDFVRRASWLPLERMRLDPVRSRDYLVKANWALYVDNYLEGFHIPFVHPGLAQQLDFGAYRTELFDHAVLQVGVADGAEEVFDLPADHPDAGQRIAGYYYWFFPNTMLNVYTWGISVNIVKPIAVDRTKVSYLIYVWDESKLDVGAGADLDRVEREDEFVVEAVQRGVRSRLYDRGRYSPTREQGVHWFHRLLAKYVG